MEENKNAKKTNLKKIIILLLIAITVVLIFVLSFDRISLNILNYDIVVSDFKVRNPELEGGFATVQYAVLVNTEKKEKYTIDYQDVWDIHEKNGNIDSVSIEIEKLSDDEIAEIKNNYTKQEILKIEQFLNMYIKSNYKIDIEK